MADSDKTVLAIRHVSFEHLGSFDALLKGWGYAVRYIDAGMEKIEPELTDKVALLAMLGGPIGAYEEAFYPFLMDELALIERRLTNGKPLFGVCLGAQLIARAAGSRVYPGTEKEIGWAPISLTEAGLTSPLAHLEASGGQVLHWHGDTFDLPTGADRLASTDVTANQAFSLGARVLGLQFHIEIAPAEIESWLIGHACEIGATPGTSVDTIRTDTSVHGAALVNSAARIFEDWLTGAGLQAGGSPTRS